MQIHMLQGEFNCAYIDLEQVESILPTAQVKPGKETYYLATNFRSGNYARVTFSNREDRDRELAELVNKLKEISDSKSTNSTLDKLFKK